MSAEFLHARKLSLDCPTASEGTDPGAINREEFRKLAEFRLALFEFPRQSEAVLEGHKIGCRQFYAMLIIKNCPDGRCVTIGKVAEGMGIHPSSASGLVAQLESAGLAERIFDLENRRQVHVKLTAQGDCLLAGIIASDAQFTKQLRDQYRDLMSKTAD